MRIASGVAFAMLLMCTVVIAGGPASTQSSTVVGVLELHSLHSDILKTMRTVRVWLPPGYQANPKVRYSVLYMHDGQNLFDRATSAYGHEWEVDETLTKLIGNHTIPPLIVVGIDNGGAERINEYTYAPHPKYGGGHGAAYTRFLLEEVKPFIENTYPVRTDAAHNFLGGSSLGALVSLEVVRLHPHVFGGVMAMSPSLWWPTEPVVDEIKQDASGFADARVWIGMGTWEDNAPANDKKAADDNRWLVEEARRLSGALDAHHVENRLCIAEGAHHNEVAWAARFGEAITYLLTESEFTDRLSTGEKNAGAGLKIFTGGGQCVETRRDLR